MPTLLQFDFPMRGPWGDEMAAAFGDLADIIGNWRAASTIDAAEGWTSCSNSDAYGLGT